MSEIITQLTIIQPNVEHVALSHQSPHKMAYSTTVFARKVNFLKKDMKRILNVGAITKNKNVNQTNSRTKPP